MIWFDVDKTLEELEDADWGEPSYHSHLVETCHELRRKPLRDFTIEDLRIMIGQQIGLPFLVPLALDILEQNPLAEGDFFAGDLLYSVFRVRLVFLERSSAAPGTSRGSRKQL